MNRNLVIKQQRPHVLTFDLTGESSRKYDNQSKYKYKLYYNIIKLLCINKIKTQNGNKK